MTISKEERAELRLELSNARLGFPLPWRLGEDADIVDDDGDAVADCMVENSFTGSSAERYIVAAANAMPVLLDTLDAADERISVLESENRRALELIDIGLAETAKWQGHLERTEDKLNARIAELEAEVARLKAIFDDAGKGEHNVLALVEHYQEREAEADEAARKAVAEAEALKARITELEAAAQWRPMSEAPRDGSRVLVGNGRNSPVFARFIDRQWRSDEKLGIVRPSHWLPIPALPEGGV